MKNILFSVFLIFSISAFSQSTSRWSDHLSYKNTTKVALFKEKILVASQYGFFIYNTEDNSVEKFSKVNGLTGEELSSIFYVEQFDIIAVSYIDGEFSLIDNNRNVSTISDIKNSSISGSKKINDIGFYNDNLILATDFGIVEYNLSELEFGDSFFFGLNGGYIQVNAISISQGLVYAATNSGIYKADLNNDFLVDYRQWVLQTDISTGPFNSVAAIGDKVFANMPKPYYSQFYFDGNNWQNISNSISIKSYVASASSVLSISDNKIEVLDGNNSVVKSFGPPSGVNWYANHGVLLGEDVYFSTDDRGLSSNLFSREFVYPDGPQKNDGFRINSFSKRLYLSYGGFDLGIYAPNGRLMSPEKLSNNQWEVIPISDLFNLKSIIDVVENPNDENDLFFISYGYGAVHKNEQGSTFYNHENSTLQKLIYSDPNYVSIRIGGGKYDEDGNLWLVHGWNVPAPFVMLSKEGVWYKFDTSDIGMNFDYGMTKPVIDAYGNKWVGTGRSGVWAFNENKTLDNSSDDFKKMFTTSESSGGLPSLDVRSIAIDKDQNLWIGTTKGLVVFNDVENLPNLSTFSAKPIIIEENGVGQKLLGELFVSKIVVDGANNKWFATNGGGVYYTNYNGQKTIYHFTKENSALPSDEIYDLDVDPVTGAVYILTTKGLYSFQGEASEGTSSFEDMIVYPNPVRPNYDGEIFIRGLGEKSNIKITDVNGNLVYETTSNGGMATWNGRSFDGVKVGSGVYFIFALNSDGSDSKITKLLIVR